MTPCRPKYIHTYNQIKEFYGLKICQMKVIIWFQIHVNICSKSYMYYTILFLFDDIDM